MNKTMKIIKFKKIFAIISLAAQLIFQPVIPIFVLAQEADTSIAPPPNISPIAAISGPSLITPGGAAQFSSAGSSDPDGFISGYSWDFSYDGQIFNIESTEANPAYTYKTFGVYTVALQAIDNQGAVSNISIASITINSTPKVMRIEMEPIPAYWDYELDGKLRSYDPEGDAITPKRQWYKNGIPIPGAVNRHLELSAYTDIQPNDVLTVAISACDKHACSPPFTSDPLAISNYLPEAKANGPYSGYAFKLIKFSSAGSIDTEGPIAGYEWDFDYDGANFTIDSTEENPEFTYKKGGKFKAALRVIDKTGGKSSISAASVSVNGPPVIKSIIFFPSDPHLGEDLNALPSVLDGDGDPVTMKYKWRKNGDLIPEAVGDNLDLAIGGDIRKGDSLELEVEACDPFSCSPVFSSAKMIIINKTPTALIDGPFLAKRGEPLILAAPDSGDQDGAISKYEWDLHYDGNSFDAESEGLSPQINFDAIGSYTIGLRVTDDERAVSEIATSIVTVCEPSECGKSVLVNNHDEASVANNIVVDAYTGNNNVAGGSGGDVGDDGQAGSGGTGLISSGNAVGVANASNIVNTNLINAAVDQSHQNVYGVYQGDLNVAGQLDALSEQSGGTGDISLLTINNQNSADVSTVITVNAGTGGNSSAGNGALTNTGNVQAAANIFNLVNTNVVGGSFLFSSMNVFGEWNGDLVLPGDLVYTLQSQGIDIIELLNNNTLELENIIKALGNTGDNSATALEGGDSEISTGLARVFSKVFNFANLNIVGGNYLLFIPNILGQWKGKVIDGEDGDYNLAFVNEGKKKKVKTVAANGNKAKVSNAIYINGDTGANSAGSDKSNASVNSGRVDVVANIMNFVNSNLVNTNIVVSVLNMFGSWSGNIVYAYPDLAAALDDGADFVAPGNSLIYTIAYGNGGKAKAKEVKTSLTLPEGVVYQSNTGGTDPVISGNTLTWSAPVVSNSEVKSFTVQTTVSSDLSPATATLEAVVAVSTQTREKRTENNSATIQTAVQFPANDPPVPPGPDTGSGNQPPSDNNGAEKISASLVVKKFNDAKGSKAPGDIVNFTVSVENTGNALIDKVKIADILRNPKDKSLKKNYWEIGEVMPGEEFEITYSVAVSSDAMAGTYTNTAQASGVIQGDDAIIYSNEAKSSFSVRDSPPINNAKDGNTVDQNNQSDSSVDSGGTSGNSTGEKISNKLEISKTNDLTGPIQPGSIVGYSITLKNTGDSTIKNIVVSDELVNGLSKIVLAAEDLRDKKITTWDFKELKPGVGLRITYQLAISGNAPAGFYTNTTWAEGEAKGGDKVYSNAASSTIEILSMLGVNIPADSGDFFGIASASAAENMLGFPSLFSPLRQIAGAETCQSWPQSIWILLFLLYASILVWFYFFDGKKWRVVFPSALTIVAIGVYLIYACPGSFIWWPMSVLASGFALTALAINFHRNRRAMA